MVLFKTQGLEVSAHGGAGVVTFCAANKPQQSSIVTHGELLAMAMAILNWSMERSIKVEDIEVKDEGTIWRSEPRDGEFLELEVAIGTGGDEFIFYSTMKDGSYVNVGEISRAELYALGRVARAVEKQEEQRKAAMANLSELDFDQYERNY